MCRHQQVRVGVALELHGVRAHVAVVVLVVAVAREELEDVVRQVEQRACLLAQHVAHLLVALRQVQVALELGLHRDLDELRLRLRHDGQAGALGLGRLISTT